MSRFLLNGYDLYGNAPQAGGGFAPIGTIISYMGTTAPQDYLICNGTVYNISDYQQLADFIGVQFGSVNFFGGNGTTTFAVPDLRGEFLRGTGTNSHTGQGNGANVGTHQDATEIPRFKLSDDSSPKVLALQRFPSDGQSHYIGNSDSLVGGKSTVAASITVTTNSTASEEYMFTSRPTNTSVLYCIKAICEGDVYSTNERMIGTWIDGKRIYQKVANYPSGLSIAAEDYTNTNIDASNIDTLISFTDGGITGDTPTPVMRYSIGSAGYTNKIVVYSETGGTVYNFIYSYTKTVD